MHYSFAQEVWSHVPHLPSLLVEGHLKILLDSINGVSQVPWRIKFLVQDIQQLTSSFNSISFKHIHREANFVANASTHYGH